MARIIIINDDDKKIELGHRQVETLTHALSVAAQRFDEDAKAFAEIIVQGDAAQAAPKPVEPVEPMQDKDGKLVIKFPIITRQGAVQMQDQFERQAREARGVLAVIEGDEGDELEDNEERGLIDPDRERFGGQG